MSHKDLEKISLDLRGTADSSNMLPQETHFQYKALRGESHQIRLMRLKRASEGPIECDTVVRNLTRPASRDAIPYEVVSYLWGDPELCEKITVDGQPLPVTRNAFEMLDSLRRAEHKYLWIDAICINQCDVTERSHQVQQMGEIYSSARQVVIYLGRPTADTDFLMKAMSEVQKKSKCHGPRLSFTEWTAVQASLCRESIDAKDRQRSAMRDLLSRSYFDRVWIIQEISLPSSGLVCCGDWSVSCETFVSTIHSLDIRPSAYRAELLRAMPTLARQVNFLDDGHDLFTVLSRYSEAKAFDQRDRIYAILGLVRLGYIERLVVDYGQSEAEVVRHATAHICRCSVESLQVGDAATTVASFIKSLPTLHQDVLSQLVRSTHSRAYLDVVILLADPFVELDITPTILRDAAANQVHGNDITRELLRYNPSVKAIKARPQIPIHEKLFEHSNAARGRSPHLER
ncbi:HET domain-containing protein [Microdochium nivale]|nr:HET domain-containing protein [Microdochium nivale]